MKKSEVGLQPYFTILTRQILVCKLYINIWMSRTSSENSNLCDAQMQLTSPIKLMNCTNNLGQKFDFLMQWLGHQEAVCLPILPWTDQSWVRFPLILAILMFAEMSFRVRKMIVIAILFRVKIGYNAQSGGKILLTKYLLK